MHFVNPWNLSRKEPRREPEAASFPWRHSGRSPRSKRAGHRGAYPWDKLSGLVGTAIGRKKDREEASNGRKRQGVEIDELQDRVEVKVDVPRVRKADLVVDHQGAVLCICGKARQRNGRSRQFSEFTYEIPLDDPLRWRDARARLKKDTLTVEIPRASTGNGRREVIRVE